MMERSGAWFRSMPTLGDRYRPDDNSFGAIRLVLAICVLVSHAWPLGFAAASPGYWLTGTQGDLGLLIGKHGSTIDAIQHLVFRAAFRGSDDRKQVIVDAAGYRERREAALHRMADRAAAEALQYDRPVELEPMRAMERKVVHTYLSERGDIETHSEGDEPDRRLVLTPVRGIGSD